jgi:hypothetical protein
LSADAEKAHKTELLIFGDFDAKIAGAGTYKYLLEEVRESTFNNKVLIHMGDVSYDLEDDGG